MKSEKFEITNLKEWLAVQTRTNAYVSLEKWVPFTLSFVFGKKRSTAQNRYLWGVVYKAICDKLKEQGIKSAKGKEITDEDIHDICKATFLERSDKFRIFGLVFHREASTTELSTTEFMEYIGEIRGYFAVFGVDIREPNEQEIQDFNQQEENGGQ